MNKTAIFVSALSCLIALGGGMAYQQAYAANSQADSKANAKMNAYTNSQAVTKPADSIVKPVSSAAALQDAPVYGSMSLYEFEDRNEIKIPTNVEQNQQASGNKITHKLFTSITDNSGSDMLQVVYVTQDKSEINLFQIKSNDRNPQTVIEAQQAYFDPSLTTSGNVKGHPALFEDTSPDGGSKKQILIATEDYWYTLHTGSATVDWKDLKEIAQQINF
ncbi:hypothetical protein B9G55_20275 [Saccharibacillus sp. O16]|nr:hypothetical protein B9G55_20275 [Saccharibacillus sp. O16]